MTLYHTALEMVFQKFFARDVNFGHGASVRPISQKSVSNWVAWRNVCTKELKRAGVNRSSANRSNWAMASLATVCYSSPAYISIQLA